MQSFREKLFRIFYPSAIPAVLLKSKEGTEIRKSLELLNTELEERVSRRTWELSESERKLSSIVSQLPVPLVILRGPEFIIEMANDSMLALWQRPFEKVIGRGLLELLPELGEQRFAEQWRTILRTGIAFSESEVPIYLFSPSGKRISLYLSYYNYPLFDEAGTVTGIMATVINLTEIVGARLEIEQSRELLELAVSQANMGTWQIDAETREFIPSVRLKELFGFYPDEVMPYDAAVEQISEEFREQVVTAVELAISEGKSYNLEYSIFGFHDKKVRWVSATGKLYPAKNGVPASFSGTILDITERKLEEIRKNDFIAIVSHELKTPLTSLQLYVQLLKANADQNADSSTLNLLSKIETQSEKMTAIINGFLNVSKMEAGKIHLDKKEFFLNELIRQAVTEFTLASKNKNIRVLCTEQLPVIADLDKIGQVINNLLSNAVKYSAPDRPIEIDCSRLEGRVQVSIKDSGIGIQPEDLEKIFQRFYRVESSENPSVKGFGIGLYLCSEIIERHGGRIWAESVFGKGSVFYFTLPDL